MITFKSTGKKTEPWDRTTVTLETDAVVLDELLEDFASFLRAVGYSIDTLEHVRNEED